MSLTLETKIFDEIVSMKLYLKTTVYSISLASTQYSLITIYAILGNAITNKIHISK